MQKIIEAEDHTARCKLLKYFMQSETTRLATKKSLMGLFSSESDLLSTVDEGIPADEIISQTDDGDQSKSSSFYDEPDAFQ